MNMADQERSWRQYKKLLTESKDYFNVGPMRTEAEINAALNLLSAGLKDGVLAENDTPVVIAKAVLHWVLGDDKKGAIFGMNLAITDKVIKAKAEVQKAWGHKPDDDSIETSE
jgi:hypothetical protein